MNDTELLGIPEGCVGFVYVITRLSTGKKYIGKKGFYSKITKPPLSGQKRKRLIHKESDWQKYFGSNAELLADVKVDEKDGFRREILRLCKSKSEMNYYEGKYIFETDAILRDDFYNGWLSLTVRQHMLKAPE